MPFWEITTDNKTLSINDLGRGRPQRLITESNWVIYCSNDFYVRLSRIRCAAWRPDTMAVGMPVPGRVLAPVKYRLLYCLC